MKIVIFSALFSLTGCLGGNQEIYMAGYEKGYLEANDRCIDTMVPILAHSRKCTRDLTDLKTKLRKCSI